MGFGLFCQRIMLCDIIHRSLLIFLPSSLLLFTNNFSTTMIKTSLPYFLILYHECCILHGRFCVSALHVCMHLHVQCAFLFVCSCKCIYACRNTTDLNHYNKILSRCLLGCSFKISIRFESPAKYCAATIWKRHHYREQLLKFMIHCVLCIALYAFSISRSMSIVCLDNKWLLLRSKWTKRKIYCNWNDFFCV